MFLAGAAIPALIGGKEALIAARQLNAIHVAALLAIMVVVWHLNILRVAALLRSSGHHLGYWSILRIYMATEFVSKTTPAGSGAPVAATIFLARHHVAVQTSLAIFAITAIMDVISLLLVLGIFIMAGAIFTSTQGTALALSVLLVAMISIITIVRLTITNLRCIGVLLDPLMRLLHLSHRQRRKMLRATLKLQKALTTLSQLSLKETILVWGASIAYWLLFLSTMHVVIYILGGEIPWSESGAIQLAAMGIGHMTLLPGGLGGTEISAGLMLTSKLGALLAGSSILIWRAFTLYLYLITGGLLFFSLLMEKKNGQA